MKKRYVWVAFSVVMLAVVVIGGLLLYTYNQKEEYLVKLAQKAEKYGADVLVCGNLKDTPKADIRFRRISRINQQTLEGEAPDAYHLVILSDMDGKLALSDEELTLLREYCVSKHYDMFYVGNKHIEQLVRCGFDTMVLEDEYALFFNGYQFKDGCPYTFDGKCWVNPEKPNEFYANPYVGLVSIDTKDLKRFQRNSAELWGIALSMAFDRLK